MGTDVLVVQITDSHAFHQFVRPKVTRSSACSILTLFIVTATSRPLNKKSVCRQSADPTITADLHPQSAVRTPLSAPAVGGRTV